MTRYATTVYIGTFDGKKRRKYVSAPTKRELNRKVWEIKSYLEEGKDCYTDATFGVWSEKWMTEVAEAKGLSTGALFKYRAAVNHMNAAFAEKSLKDIRLSDFQRFINQLAIENPNTGRPMSKESLKNIKKVGKNIFGYAQMNDIAGVSNFFDFVQIPVNAPQKHRTALSEAEMDAVVNTPHRGRPFAMLLLFTGLRVGEAVPLEWDDIDFEKKQIRITKSADLQSNTPIVKSGGKTTAATRLLPLPPILEECLLEWKKVQGPGHTLLFEKAHGDKEMMSKSSVHRLWVTYRNALNEGKPEEEKFTFTPHCLRHTYATMLYLQSVDLREAMQCMGHSNIQVTINIYTDTQNFYKFGMSDSLREKMEVDYRIFPPSHEVYTGFRQLTLADFL